MRERGQFLAFMVNSLASVMGLNLYWSPLLPAVRSAATSMPVAPHSGGLD